jgi:hypothetical protein
MLKLIKMALAPRITALPWLKKRSVTNRPIVLMNGRGGAGLIGCNMHRKNATYRLAHLIVVCGLRKKTAVSIFLFQPSKPLQQEPALRLLPSQSHSFPATSTFRLSRGAQVRYRIPM